MADTPCRESDASVQGFPGGTSGKESACNAGNIKDTGSIPGLEHPLEKGMATHSRLLLPGESNGQRSLVHYRPWGCRKSDMTEVTARTRVINRKKHCHPNSLQQVSQTTKAEIPQTLCCIPHKVSLHWLGHG